jgi:hypothetical protein
MARLGGHLDELVDGRRVLFINAIRSDVPSGGNTCTQALLKRLHKATHVHELPFSRSASGSALAFILFSLPAPLFVYLHRLTRHAWLEFMLRLSVPFLIQCAWVRWRYSPDVVVLNHHSAFLYARFFKGSQRVFVWHDVPSFKQDRTRRTHRAAIFCVGLERWLLRAAEHCITFSFDEQKVLRRLHKQNALIVPLIDTPSRKRQQPLNHARYLLIGNWTRFENSAGALAFFKEYVHLASNSAHGGNSCFRLAGYGASKFVGTLQRSVSHSAELLNVMGTERYADISDFDECLLLAPLLSGAGIKLKTIEAFANDIPVIGTRQAFTGIPAHIWHHGGIRVETLTEMAHLCLNPAAMQRACEFLTPNTSYAMYQQAVSPNNEWHNSWKQGRSN